MNTMEITKVVGAFCGSLLVFLLISTFAGAIFDTSSEAVAFTIPVEDAGEGGAEQEAVDVPALVAAADAAKGATVFRKCAACHKVDGTDGVGPHLDGVVNRGVGAIAGFNYSAPMASHGGNWDEESLYKFLQSPKGFVPGTAMAFAGLPKSDERANVIAYLASLNQ